MRWILPLVLLIAGTSARGEECVVGKVVCVPDGGSVWVFLPSFQACYHVTLSDCQAPPLDQPLGPATRDALCRLVLGQQVQVTVDRLRIDGETAGQMFLRGESVNGQIAQFVANGGQTVPMVRYCDVQPRPLLNLCSALRSLLGFPNAPYRPL